MDEDRAHVRRPEARDANERGVYIISVAAELVGVHPQTLRIYERKGLLRPSRTSGNTRRYSERDIRRLQTIQRLTQEGVNLAGVKMIVEMENEMERLRERMHEMRAEIERVRQRASDEIERIRREHRADLVPLSDARRFTGSPGAQPPAGRVADRQSEAPRAARSEAPSAAQEYRRRRPIPMGPVRPRIGPIAVGPGDAGSQREAARRGTAQP